MGSPKALHSALRFQADRYQTPFFSSDLSHGSEADDVGAVIIPSPLPVPTDITHGSFNKGVDLPHYHVKP